MIFIVSSILRKNLSENWNQKSEFNSFHTRNIFETAICNMTTILFRPQYVSQYMYRCVRSLFVGRISGSRVPCRITNPDSNVGWVNVGPKLGLQFRRGANVGPTRIDVWEPWHNIIVMFNVIVCQICVDGVVATLRVCYFSVLVATFYYPLNFQDEWVLSLPASVHLSVRPSVNFTSSAQ